MVPQEYKQCEYFSIIYYIFSILFETTCSEKNGIPFLALVPPPFHKAPMLLHTHWAQDLDPIVIPKEYITEGRL